MRAYNDMMEGTGFANSMETNGISPYHYKNGWAFFIFNLTADLENSAGFELIKSGTTSILIRFAHKVPNGGIQMIAYGVRGVGVAYGYKCCEIAGDGFAHDAGQEPSVDQRPNSLMHPEELVVHNTVPAVCNFPVKGATITQLVCKGVMMPS
jgi:hypothetical protein